MTSNTLPTGSAIRL